MKASKAKAAIQRERQRQLKLQEEQQVAARAAALKNMTAGFARTARSDSVIEAFNASKIPVYPKARTTSSRTLDERFPTQVVKQKQQLSEDMQKREALAVQHYETVMKSRIGPAFNKSGDMYLSESELAAEKKGELRRRS
jgi:hypothetical protein